MTFENADQPRKVHVTIWSPSSAPDSQSVKRETLPLSEDVRFMFYKPATSDKGGAYAEA
jgi:hypothetical protein